MSSLTISCKRANFHYLFGSFSIRVGFLFRLLFCRIPTRFSKEKREAGSLVAGPVYVTVRVELTEWVTLKHIEPPPPPHPVTVTVKVKL